MPSAASWRPPAENAHAAAAARSAQARAGDEHSWIANPVEPTVPGRSPLGRRRRRCGTRRHWRRAAVERDSEASPTSAAIEAELEAAGDDAAVQRSASSHLEAALATVTAERDEVRRSADGSRRRRRQVAKRTVVRGEAAAARARRGQGRR